MKIMLTVLLAVLLLLTSLPLTACQNTENTEKTPDSDELTIAKDASSDYVIVYASELETGDLELLASLDLKNGIRTATGANITRNKDEKADNGKEILVGKTNRQASKDASAELLGGEFVIKAVGEKLVICGSNAAITYYAVQYFIQNHLTQEGAVVLEKDLNYKGSYDMSVSSTHNKSFVDMGDELLTAFAGKYLEPSGKVMNTEFWDTAEIMEAFLDAYEQTGKAEYLEYAEDIARLHFGSLSAKTNWLDNPYNDDIAWACIAFTRLYNFTNKSNYLTIAKNNFNRMWQRAYTQDLGGGLWWKDDEKTCKNSCIQCPASIAACLIGKATGDDSYYEKAVTLMKWEVDVLFNEKTGAVYDSVGLDNSVWEAVFSYNLGTFVGACTLLHEKYGDAKYMDYAAKAVSYGMTKLENRNGVLNGESDGYDGIGFKGILTRWYYRYAVYTNDTEILFWLQKNANSAYKNRNSENIIWTTWATKTQDKEYDPFGVSSALALLFNCEPWW